MIQKIKNKLLILSSLLMLGAPMAAPALASAANPIKGGLCHGAQSLVVTNGVETCTESGGGFTATLRKFVNIISVIIGIVAVIMIIFGGFRYITSGGKQESVSAAKNTILYALIGLIIVALAQVIVRFVLANTPA
jgi:hypothetical protein